MNGAVRQQIDSTRCPSKRDFSPPHQQTHTKTHNHQTLNPCSKNEKSLLEEEPRLLHRDATKRIAKATGFRSAITENHRQSLSPINPEPECQVQKSGATPPRHLEACQARNPCSTRCFRTFRLRIGGGGAHQQPFAPKH